MRVLSRVCAALTIAAGLVIAAGPVASAAPVDCQYQNAKKLVTLSIAATTSAWIHLEREVGTTRIGYTAQGAAWHGCEGARTTTTNKIKVIGSTLSDDLSIDLGNGPFAPGAAPERRGVAEIEFELDLGDGTDVVTLVGGSGGAHLGFPARGKADLNGDADTDVTMSGADEWILVGSDGDDVLDGSGAPHVTAYGGAGADRLVGGDGQDVFYGDDNGQPGGADVIIGGDGDDNLYGNLGNDTLRGEGGDDTLNGHEDRDVLNGGEGDDYLYAMATRDGADDFVGGPGYDRASFADRAAHVSLSLDGRSNDGAKGEGDNVSPSVEMIVGGDGNDTLTGSAQGNSLSGDDGKDTLIGLQGDDDLWGGNGDDTLRGGSGDEYFGSESGDDRFFGDAGDDTMAAGSSPDGQDVYSGGEGQDEMNYASRSAPLLIDVNDPRGDGDTGTSENDNVHPDFEYVYGGSATDVIRGGSGEEYLNAGGGVIADLINGRRGADTLVGNDGDDHLIGEEGKDRFYAGDGDDQIEAADGGEDLIDCGSGAGDMVLTMDAVDSTSACELLPL